MKLIDSPLEQNTKKIAAMQIYADLHNLHDMYKSISILEKYEDPNQKHLRPCCIKYANPRFRLELVETLRSTTRPAQQRGPNFSSKMSARHFDAIKV